MSIIKKLKTANKMKDEITGYINDLNKIHTAASNIVTPNENSRSELVALAFEGIGVIGSRNPIISHYLKAHEAHFAALTSVIKAVDTAKDAMNILNISRIYAQKIRKSADVIEDEFGYVFSMLNQNNSLPDELPRELKNYYGIREEFASLGYKGSEWSTTNEKSKSINPYARDLQNKIDQMAEQEAVLKIFVLKRAKEIASAYLKINKDTYDLFYLMVKGSRNFSKQLNKVSGNDGFIAGKSAYEGQQFKVFNEHKKLGYNSNSTTDDLTLYSKGGSYITELSAIKIAGEAMRDVRDLSEKWKVWAFQVSRDGDFLDQY